MPNGIGANPRFRLHYQRNTELRDRGYDPFTYFAFIGLSLSVGPRRMMLGKNFPFRLDTEAFISVVPEQWLNNTRVRPFLKVHPSPLRFATTVGRASALVARGVFVQFPPDARELALDFLMLPSLNARQYGLISLRDIINHFALETVGNVRYSARGEPEELPDLVLHPR